MTFTLGIYIKKENYEQNIKLQENLKNIVIKQTQIFVYHSLDGFRFHNMVFIDCEFEKETLNQTFELISIHYLGSESNSRPLYMFIYLFTNPEMTKICSINESEKTFLELQSLNKLFQVYHLKCVSCSNVLFIKDISMFYIAPANYSMGYWGYLKHGIK